MALRVAELESLFTANIQPFEQAAQKVEARQKSLDGTIANLHVDADTATALRNLDRVEASAQGLPDAAFDVTADTSGAERALDRLADDAEGSFSTQGETVGQAFMGGLIGGLASTPIAGIVVGIAQDIKDGIESGFDVEVRADRLAATTGLDPITVGRLGRAAGEAYADNWGESVDSNFGLLRTSLQSSLLDPQATKRDAQQLVSDLAGVSDLLEEEGARVARSTAQLIKTGIAADADEAFDIIVKGQQAGLNASEDWLDTLDEYSTKFRDLGLTGPQTLGLLRQAIDAGARDTDKAADALKEFQIRATDGSEASAAAFELLGLNAADMAAQIARGGQDASTGLDTVLDRLRAVEDPASRTAAAVGLFGTQAEDLGQALYSMDLSNAVDQLGAVEGAARTALGVLSDNTQNDLDTAVRNIEIAAEGVKGALASAFSPQIEGAANFVTENREEVIQFLLDIANGALDMGDAIVEGLAVGTEAVGAFLSGPLADVASALADIAETFIDLPGGPSDKSSVDSLRATVEAMRGSDETWNGYADVIRGAGSGIDQARDVLNGVGDTMLNDARAHDTAYALAKDIDGIATTATGAIESLTLLNGALDTTTATGQTLDTRMTAIADGMRAQAEAAILAGDSSKDLDAALQGSRDALVDQLEQMGLTEDEANALADAYGLIPGEVITDVTMNGYETTYAYLTSLQAELRALTGDHTIRVATGQGGSGGLVAGMALGGVLSPGAQTVAPGTFRVVGDRLDVDEAYIPLDGSPRSIAILLEAMRRMPGFQGMAAGGVTGTPTVIPQSVTHRTEAPIYIENFNGSVEDVEGERRRRRFNGLGGNR